MSEIPTPERVRAEIEALRELKPKVRRTTIFGDDNHAAIEAQILVLSKGMDSDAIYDHWWRDEEDDHERSAAMSALEWLEHGETSEGEDTLVEGWQSLATG